MFFRDRIKQDVKDAVENHPQELTLHNVHSKELPDLSDLPLLEEVSIRYSDGLVSIDALRGCPAIKHLELTGCNRLVSVEAIRELPNLEFLNIGFCGRLRSLEPVGNAEALKTLWIDWGVPCLESLEVLFGCQKLSELNLELNQLITFEPLVRLAKLSSLSISMVHRKSSDVLNSLSLVNQLRTLDVSDAKLEDISFLHPLKQLEELSVSFSSLVRDLSALIELPNLRKLSVDFVPGNHSYEAVQSLSCCHRLKYLKLWAIFLENANMVKTMTELEELDFSYNYHLKDLSGVTNLSNLKVLHLNLCHEIDRASLEGLPSNVVVNGMSFASEASEDDAKARRNSECFVREIEPDERFDDEPTDYPRSDDAGTIYDLSGEKKIDPLLLEPIPLLLNLRLKGCYRMTDLSPLSSFFNSLRDLRLDDCASLTTLDTLEEMPGLIRFKLVGGLQLLDIEGLAASTGLEVVHLENCVRLSNLEPLRKLAKIKTLRLTDLRCLDISFLQNMPDLEQLELIRLELSNFAPLSALRKLGKLTLHGLPSLNDLAVLRSLPQLMHLVIHQCPVTSLEPLAELKDLLTLSIYNLDICSVEPLVKLKKLQSIDLRGCTLLLQIDSLASLPHLKIIDLGESFRVEIPEWLTRRTRRRVCV